MNPERFITLVMSILAAMSMVFLKTGVAQSQDDDLYIPMSVSLPEARNGLPAPQVLKVGSVVLTIPSDSLEDSEFSVGNAPGSLSNVAKKINSLLMNRPADQKIVYLQGGRLIKFGTVLEILNKIREAGVERIGIVVKSEKGNGICVLNSQIIKRAEVSLPSPPKQSSKTTRKPAKPSSTPVDENLFIEIKAAGGGYDQTVDLNRLAVHVTDLAKTLQSLLERRPDRTVTIKAPGDTDYGHVVTVIDVIKSAGAESIRIQIDDLHSKSLRPGARVADRAQPPLITASKENDVDAVKSLLAKGVDVNTKDSKGMSALRHAALWGHAEITRLLLDKGADLKEVLTDTLDAEIMRLLLAKGANVNETGGASYSLLMLAAQNGRRDVVQVLLDYGANVNARGISGETALILAAMRGNEKIFHALLAKGADVRARDDDGNDAFLYATIRGGVSIFQSLLERGVDVNVKNKTGYTALMDAARRSRMEIVEFLLANKADVNARDMTGKTALIYAVESQVEKRSVTLIRALLDKGAEVNARGNDGKTALAYAVEVKDAEIIDLLKGAGAKE